MNQYQDLANSVKLKVKRNRISILHQDSSLKHIGTGRSAVVFKIQGTNKAIKIFFPAYEKVAVEEANIYKKLKGIIYYPTLHDYGQNYLVIDYIDGYTLFECLTKGIEIKPLYIKETDNALAKARKVGLTPSDVHIRNIILTKNGNIKLIDVARFKQSNGCKQWEDLKKAYDKFYIKRCFPKRIPAFILNIIAYLYNIGIVTFSDYSSKQTFSWKKRIRKSS
ncbi:serine/threonine protein kinase [Oceanobacillus senegalensis]|uniref:serine/threonine protein kinase n=1 Tax=Oceanobacillus senegalensis TaxID=1936063 RepID=UPI000A3133E9|nr:serine/threonine protein kinase [Oceanobacillus senegalensis]